MKQGSKTCNEPSPGTAKSKQASQGEEGSATHLPARPPRRARGDSRDLSFLELSAGSIDLIVTSPPYWRRRDYGHVEQLGQEPTPEQYVHALLEALGNWSRLLRPHGSIFLNIGDTYLDGFLVGVPALFELAAREAGWRVVNQISWIKSIGMPERRPYRLASRHEPVYHLTQAKKAQSVFFDLFALAQDLGQSANPGDTWKAPWPDDTWSLHPARSRSDHLAPFPPELARRAILLACPERVCPACGWPYTRRLEPSAILESSRPQARRAMELAREHGLTEAHFAAIRAVGISDAGKGKRLQGGKNAENVRSLALHAKEKLGGYFREFTFAPKKQVGWEACECGVPTISGTVLDPFMGSGTTLAVAESLGRNAVGVDLIASEGLQSAKSG